MLKIIVEYIIVKVFCEVYNMWRCVRLLFGLCVIGLALGLANVSFSETEKDIEQMERELDQFKSHKLVDEHLKKWGNEYLNKEFQNLKTEIDEQQKANKAEFDRQSDHAKTVMKNSTIILSTMKWFVAIFAVFIGGFGFMTAWRVHKLEKEATGVINILKKKGAIADEILSNLQETEKKVYNVSSDAEGKLDEWTVEAASEILKQPEADKYLRSLAIQAIDEERWQSALYLWEKVLEKEPKDFDAFFYAILSIGKILEEKKYPANDLLWAIANNYFEKASKLNDQYAIFWTNWGYLLQEQAKAENDKDMKNALWDKAEGKHEKATNIDKKLIWAWNNWGLLLQERARAETDEKNKNTLWANAKDKYHEATTKNEEYAIAWANWGIMLGEQALVEQDVKKRADLWAKANDNFINATKIDKNSAYSWYWWAYLCIFQGKEALEEDRERLWAEAKEYSHTAMELDKDKAYTLDAFATLCSYQGEAEVDQKEKERLWNKANEYYDKTIKLDQDYAFAWYNWSKLRNFQAEYANAEDDKKAFLKKADYNYQRAIDLDPLLVDYLDSIFKDK